MPVSPRTDPYYRLRHSTAHVMAQAVLELFPDGKLAIGPPVEDGFYYDFDLPHPLTHTDLADISERMRRIIREDYPFERRIVDTEEARALFKDQPYKLELIQGLLTGRDDHGEVGGDSSISTYRQGSFEDLCRGPHLERTGNIPLDGFALLTTSGAYWRGDERRPMLQRIYGTVWNYKSDLDAYLWRLEEAKKRDHRQLGKDLDLFSISEDVGPGLILWHPKGAMIRLVAEEFSRAEHLKHGYQWVFSPHIGRAGLWQTSGHLEYFRENMFAPMDIDGDPYYAKPMNCPFHIQVYKSHLRSYRDLPVRYAEFGAVYRYERSGVLHGLTRVRGFTQDDAHIFCRADQVEQEIESALAFSLFILRAFGLVEFKGYLSTQPEKVVGNPADWDRATGALRAALEQHNIAYDVDEGGGAFYGPKIDLKVRDALGREWQLSTIQFDFTLPARFNMEYTGEDGKPRQPYMVHRALLGSMERFFGVLIEHFGGAFPLWLAPVQAMVIPISTERHLDFAHTVEHRLKEAGLRVELDAANTRMQARIREAQLQKVPYMLIVGDKERETDSVAVRLRSGEDLGAIAVNSLIARLLDEEATRSTR